MVPTLVAGTGALPLATAADASVSLTTVVTGAGDLLLAADVGDLLPAAGVGDLLPAAGVGDLPPAAGAGEILPTVCAGVFSLIAGAGLFLPAADAEASTAAHCWTGGGLPATFESRSSNSEKSTPPDKELCSRMDSVWSAVRGLPS